jgi:hypothetical protein
MEQALMVYREKLIVYGQHCRIEIYRQGQRNFFAMTRFDENDAIICDGFSVDEVLAKHRGAIPLALGSRLSSRRRGRRPAVAA